MGGAVQGPATGAERGMLPTLCQLVASPGHDHPVMGSFKWAAASVLAHLVGTCPGTHLCLAGQLGPADACAQPAGIAHPSCWAAFAMGRAGICCGLLQGDVWQHDLQHAMWLTLLAMESKAARWEGSTLGSALLMGCCCCRSPARCVPCTRSRTGAARTSGPASLSRTKRRSVPEASRQAARLPQSAGWPQRRSGGPV